MIVKNLSEIECGSEMLYVYRVQNSNTNASHYRFQTDILKVTHVRDRTFETNVLSSDNESIKVGRWDEWGQRWMQDGFMKGIGVFSSDTSDEEKEKLKKCLTARSIFWYNSEHLHKK